MVEIFLTFFSFSISLTQHYFCWTKAKAYVSLTYCSTHIFRYRRFRSSIMRSWKVLKWYCILHQVRRYYFCFFSFPDQLQQSFLIFPIIIANWKFHLFDVFSSCHHCHSLNHWWKMVRRPHCDDVTSFDKSNLKKNL